MPGDQQQPVSAMRSKPVPKKLIIFRPWLDEEWGGEETDMDGGKHFKKKILQQHVRPPEVGEHDATREGVIVMNGGSAEGGSRSNRRKHGSGSDNHKQKNKGGLIKKIYSVRAEKHSKKTMKAPKNATTNTSAPPVKGKENSETDTDTEESHSLRIDTEASGDERANHQQPPTGRHPLPTVPVQRRKSIAEPLHVEPQPPGNTRSNREPDTPKAKRTNEKASEQSNNEAEASKVQRAQPASQRVSKVMDKSTPADSTDRVLNSVVPQPPTAASNSTRPPELPPSNPLGILRTYRPSQPQNRSNQPQQQSRVLFANETGIRRVQFNELSTSTTRESEAAAPPKQMTTSRTYHQSNQQPTCQPTADAYRPNPVQEAQVLLQNGRLPYRIPKLDELWSARLFRPTAANNSLGQRPNFVQEPQVLRQPTYMGHPLNDPLTAGSIRSALANTSMVQRPNPTRELQTIPPKQMGTARVYHPNEPPTTRSLPLNTSMVQGLNPTRELQTMPPKQMGTARVHHSDVPSTAGPIRSNPAMKHRSYPAQEPQAVPSKQTARVHHEPSTTGPFRSTTAMKHRSYPTQEPSKQMGGTARVHHPHELPRSIPGSSTLTQSSLPNEQTLSGLLRSDEVRRSAARGRYYNEVNPPEYGGAYYRGPNKQRVNNTQRNGMAYQNHYGMQPPHYGYPPVPEEAPHHQVPYGVHMSRVGRDNDRVMRMVPEGRGPTDMNYPEYHRPTYRHNQMPRNDQYDYPQCYPPRYTNQEFYDGPMHPNQARSFGHRGDMLRSALEYSPVRTQPNASSGGAMYQNITPPPTTRADPPPAQVDPPEMPSKPPFPLPKRIKVEPDIETIVVEDDEDLYTQNDEMDPFMGQEGPIDEGVPTHTSAAQPEENGDTAFLNNGQENLVGVAPDSQTPEAGEGYVNSGQMTCDSAVSEQYVEDKIRDLKFELKNQMSSISYVSKINSSTLDPAQYCAELEELRKARIHDDFISFYEYVTRVQIRANHEPVSFNLFLEFLNAGRLTAMHDEFIGYREKKLRRQGYYVAIVNGQNEENRIE